MQSQTELILEALAHTDRFAVARAILEKDQTEKELRVRLGLDQTATTRALTHLRLVGLIERERPRGAYRVSFNASLKALLRTASYLATQINESRNAVDDALKSDSAP